MAEELKKAILTKGKDGDFFIDLNKSNGRPQPIVGWTLIKVILKNEDGTDLELFAPLTAGVDEVQDITFDNVPDSGAFTLSFAGEKTASLAFNASNTDVENALNALRQLSSVTVAGDFTSGFTVTFATDDGDRAQPLISVTDNTLLIVAAAVVTTVTETTPGVSESGVDVVDQNCTRLNVKVGEDKTALLKAGVGQTVVVDVRIGSQDLNIPPIENVLDVKTA